MRRLKVVYLTYDGVLDPLGRSQVLPYLEGLAAKGVSVTVVSFEKRHSPKERKRYAERLAQQGIRWIPLRYHKWPPVLATLFDVIQGSVLCSVYFWRERPALVHSRGYVVSMMALGIKWTTGARFLFDMRGFWPEERVEGGLSRPKGWVYRSAKWWERRFFHGCDGIVVLSEVAKRMLEERFRKEGLSIPITVIPTCTDLQKFVPSPREEEMDLKRIAYVGSVGTWYLIEEMVHFFKILQEKIPSARLTILTPRPDPHLEKALKDLDAHLYEVQKVTHEEVPPILKTMDVSLCFIKGVGSKRASCPTKVGESLACGVPIVITKDIGDCDRLTARERVGVVVSELSPLAYRKAVEELVTVIQEGPALRERCRRVAERYFDLTEGVKNYFSFYNQLLRKEEIREEMLQ